jgi:hypothetical protein
MHGVDVVVVVDQRDEILDVGVGLWIGELDRVGGVGRGRCAWCRLLCRGLLFSGFAWR